MDTLLREEFTAASEQLGPVLQLTNPSVRPLPPYIRVVENGDQFKLDNGFLIPFRPCASDGTIKPGKEMPLMSTGNRARYQELIPEK